MARTCGPQTYADWWSRTSQSGGLRAQPGGGLMPDPDPQQFTPGWALHPGVYLRRMLDERGIRQAELAERTGLTPKHINQIVNETIGISADVALLLERALGPSPGFWTRAEAKYPARAGGERAEAALPELTKWARSFNQVTLRRYGITEAGDSKESLVEKILRFFGVASPEAFDRTWIQPRYRSAAASPSPSTSRIPRYGCAW